MTSRRHPVRPVPALLAGIVSFLWLLAGVICVDHCQTASDGGKPSIHSAKSAGSCCHKAAGQHEDDEGGSPGSCRLLAVAGSALELSAPVATLPTVSVPEAADGSIDPSILVPRLGSIPEGPFPGIAFREPAVFLGPACRSTAPPVFS